jgi:hypothetical protein
MSTGAVVAVVVVILVVLVLLALLLRMQTQRRHLQQRFGPEYDRTLQERENRREAEKELAGRERRYDQLDIRPLSPDKRDQYRADWRRVQEQFVDAPEEAVTEADRMVTLVMRERGYPTDGYEQQLADLSVAHARTLEHYRKAHDINLRVGSDVSTEDMRQAMVHYRALFAELLGEERGRLAGRAQVDEARTDSDQPVNQTLPSQERAHEDNYDYEARHRGGNTDATR